jgi:4-hydroxy-tetrahydrodipicolinate reductase
VIRVCFSGVTGWTAQALVPAIVAADDLDLVAGVSRSAAGRPLADVTATGSDGPVCATVAEALRATPADVVVDYTSAAAVRENVWAAVAAGVPCVVGTSGLTGDDYAELDALARDRGVGVVAAGNFSVLAAVLRRAAALAAEHVRSWEIVDYADAAKPDVPSGTARDLAELLGGIGQPTAARPLAQLQGPIEARGADIAGTRVHSVRLPGFVVTTEVVFGAAGEKLVLRHDPGESPQPYVAGTLLAVRRVRQVVGVRRGLDSLMFDD